jgi:CBS domain containing-hemolysin-like protein
MDPEERQMIQNLIEFGELEVSDVMVHRSQVDAIPENLDIKSLIGKVLEMGHSRLPVYRGSLDEVIGLIHVKDLLRLIGDEASFNFKSLIRSVFAVPASMKVVDLLVKMRATRCHMAIVVDEFGGTDGIVTLEDLFEAIVGDIRDEHDDGEDNRRMQWISEDEMMVDARVEIEELESKLELSIGDEEEDREYDTMGGLVFSLLGRVPRKGERLEHKRLQISVEAADARRIHRLRIKILPPLDGDEEE